MKCFLFVSCVLLCAAVVSGQVTIPYTNCGSSSDEMQIQSASANVWPPQPNNPFSAAIALQLTTAISDGSYALTVSYDGIPLVNKKGDIKKFLKGYTWPLQPQTLSINESLTFPGFLPSGSYGIQLQASDQSGNELFCLQLAVSLGANADLDSMHALEQFQSQLDTMFNGEEEDNADFAWSDAVWTDAVTPVPVPFQSCGNNTDKLTVQAMTSDAWPPAQGQMISVGIQGQSLETINSATYNVTLFWNNLPFQQASGSIASFNGTKYPVAPGPISMQYPISIPRNMPTGTYTATMQTLDQINSELFCVAVQWQA